MSLFVLMFIGFFPLMICVFLLTSFCSDRFIITGSARSLLWGVAVMTLWLGFFGYLGVMVRIAPPDPVPVCIPVTPTP